MNNIVIGNTLIKKELHIKSDRICGFAVNNLTNGRVLECFECGEEFILSFKCGFRKIRIKSSELKIADFTSSSDGEITKYTVSFKDFGLRDSKIKVNLVYLVNGFRCYIRKYIELRYAKRGKKNIILDSISLESFTFEEKYKYWTLPEQKDSVISGFALSLGQPVYVDSLYFGCEFPVAVNKIEDLSAECTFYSGKSLNELIGSDAYISHKSVVGGAQSDIYEDVQKCFFEYIKDISKPVYLRRQYNSWYDNMLNITRENITSSFLEIEKQMTKTGEPPLDSYVADDGWNDYGAGFWSFNSNFPDELYPFKNLAEALGSKFGLWLGPRGGYTKDTVRFARKIQAAGNGFVNKQAHDICVGSKKYTEKTTELLLDFEKRFGINYFKLDGFAQRPCKNKRHDHLTGGMKDIFFYSDIWERWISSFEKLALAGGSDFWINLTCYAWPSPWFLQWVNSLWIQISLDHGFIGKRGAVSDKDRMLSYRDEVYKDFTRVRQFQFPQRALYNHDPVYGKEAKVSMSDDEFREYLFTMATRGTQFWELYYSHSLMNEAKWRINYSCLRFIEENMDILSDSVIFGGSPSNSEVYGFSCFGDHEGIVSLRNAGSEEKTYTLRLDELIGVTKSFSFGEMYTVLPYNIKGARGAYSYGDTVSFTLEPYQTRIVHFGKKNKALKPVYCKAISHNQLLVTFNQFVDASDACSEGNEITDKKLLEDYMSVIFTFKDSFDKENSISLCGIKNAVGKPCDVCAEFTYYENGIITDGSVRGKGDFTVEINLKGAGDGALFRQGDELEISVGADGFVRFRVGVCTIKSLTPVCDAVQITAVRERNNVMKLYLNKALDAGMPSFDYELKGDLAEVDQGVNIKLYNRALAYDEI